jgi:triosephosphate isomerase
MNLARRLFIGGNWKSNMTRKSAKELVEGTLNKIGHNPAKVDVVVFPNYLHVGEVSSLLTDQNVKVGVQNISSQGFGAFTGETSALHLTDSNIDYTLVGHSERRHIYGETDQELVKKANYALENGLNVIYCIGELLSEREAGNTESVMATQMEGLKSVPLESWEKMVLAYEPVWAIGTGVVASPEQAQSVHAYLRNWVKENISENVASNVRIIYGGSVSDTNCQELIKNSDIDGFLIGGVALKPAFKTVVNVSENWLA